ncbi:MAG: enoyl-CoA hydratase/isomerase family protein [Gemmatimonadetes bacterium]|nr:enoyl-CoA hydratase/isomerase family protein [Gemmatimonadota bacterium]
MSWNTLRVERNDAGTIAQVRLDRPDKRNAQSLELWDELRRVGVALQDDPALRVVVVSGAGHSFSAGIDLGVLLGQATGASTPLPEVELVQHAFRWLRESRFATIAMVQGYALGAGCQLALACDLRILADDAIMALPEIEFGIFPDLGGCAWLPELVGSAKAKELIFTADRFDAAEALRLGLANRVVPRHQLEAVTTELAERIAAKAPLGIAAAKRAIAAAEISADEALRVSATEVRKLLVSADFKEAGRAALEKRPPKYQGR